MSFHTILVLSPHTDDAELGAGGTVSRFLDEGKDLYYVVFSKCEDSLPCDLPKDTLKNECLNSLKTLGISTERLTLLTYKVRSFPEHRQAILEDMLKFKTLYKPDLVLVPSSNDMHQDHGVICCEALRAFKKEASIWGYEHPWNNLTFTTDIFVKLNPSHLERKIKALQEYKSQSHRGYMNEKYIRSLVFTRGAQLDLECAEAFELVRFIY
jgi:LmbE family N-acetylglucosaminyl deacetylase